MEPRHDFWGKKLLTRAGRHSCRNVFDNDDSIAEVQHVSHLPSHKDLVSSLTGVCCHDVFLSAFAYVSRSNGLCPVRKS